MKSNKGIRCFILSLGAVLLLNILHAFFLFQMVYEPVTLSYNISTDYDTETWVSVNPQYQDSLFLRERILIKKGETKNIKTILDYPTGIEFLSTNWEYSDLGTFTISEIEFIETEKTYVFQNLNKFINYSSDNTTVVVDSTSINITSNENARGWLMIDTDEFDYLAKRKVFKPFGLPMNILLFVVALIVFFFFEETIRKNLKEITINGPLAVRLRGYNIYFWACLIPFWIVISHSLLAISIGFMLVHYFYRKSDFDLRQLKKFSPLWLLYFSILTIDAIFYQNALSEDIGNNIYFLLIPFVFLGLSSDIMKGIFKVSQWAIILYGVLLLLAGTERFFTIADSTSFQLVFVETLETYWHSSYLAGFILIALFYEAIRRKISTRIIVISILALGFILLSQARLSFIIGFTILLWIFSLRIPQNLRKKLYVLAAAVLVVGSLTLFMESPRNLLLDTLFKTKMNKVDSRVKLWDESMEIAKESYLWGIGRKNIKTELSSRLSSQSSIKHRDYNSHNQYLEYLLSYGVFVALLLLFSLFYPLKWRTSYYTVFIVYFAIAMLVESYFSRQAGMIFFSFYYAFFILYDSKDQISLTETH